MNNPEQSYFETACNSDALYPYIPICDFPFLPATWSLYKNAIPTNTSNSSSTLIDCSSTFSEISNQAYTTRCLAYAILAFFPLVVSFQFIKTLLIQTKGKTNVNITLCKVNMFLSVIHLFMCIDPSSWGNRISFTTISFCQGLSASCAFSVSVILVTSWIAIIDGGKNKKTPPWAATLQYGCVAAMFLHDCGGSVLEIYVGEAANDAGAIDGTTNAIKSLIFVLIVLVYLVLTITYSLKITRILRGGSSGQISKEEKKIRRLCNAMGFCYIMILLYKLRAITSNMDKTLYSSPPCGPGEGGLVSPLQIMFLVVSWSMVWACNPDKGTGRAQAGRNIAKSAFKFGSTKGSGSSKGGTNGGSSSGKSSGKSGSGGSGTTSSGTSDASGVSGASEMSEMSAFSAVSSSSSSVYPEAEVEVEAEAEAEVEHF